MCRISALLAAVRCHAGTAVTSAVIVALAVLCLAPVAGAAPSEAGAAPSADAAPSAAALPAAVLPPMFALSDLWSWRNPAPSGNAFRALSMPNDHDAWAVTKYGGIYASNDRGKHWWLQASRGTEVLESVFFLNGNRGWVVGSGGVIRGTTDGGTSWTRQTSGTSVGMQDVWFTSTTKGWAVGDSTTLLKTTDGGSTWVPRTWGAVGIVTAIMFRDDLHGWACDSGGGVLRTSDGGANWARAVAAPGKVLRDVFFPTALRGWAVGTDVSGHGVIVRSDDGGATWGPQAAGSSVGLNAVLFLSGTNGWVCRDDAPPLRTTNGGTTWDDVPGAPDKYRDIALPDGVHGCLMGTNVATTGDGGTIWTRRDTQVAGVDLQDVSFASAKYGYACGDTGTVLGTRDGGTTWTPLPTITTNNMWSVAAASSSRAAVTGQVEGSLLGFLLLTTDGGQGWYRRGPDPCSLLYCVDFISPLVGWAGSDGGAVLKTTDGGQTWNSVASGMHASVRCIDFVTANVGFAGSGRDFFTTTDGGATWTQLERPSWNGGPVKIDFVDAQHGWAVWYDGQLTGTTDGGQTWVQQAVDAGAVTGDPFVDVAAQSARVAWAVGEFGTVYRTVDGGAHWTLQNSRTGTGVTLNAVCAVDGHVWMVGDDGVILGRNYAPLPHIVRATPSPVDAGSTLTIDGWGLGSARGSSVVKIGSTTVSTYVDWRTLRIKVKVPASVAAGRTAVKVTVGGTVSNAFYVRIR